MPSVPSFWSSNEFCFFSMHAWAEPAVELIILRKNTSHELLGTSESWIDTCVIRYHEDPFSGPRYFV